MARHGRLEVRGVARDERQPVNFDRCRDERVRDAYSPPRRFAARHDLPPSIGDGAVDRQDPLFEAERQLVP